MRFCRTSTNTPHEFPAPHTDSDADEAAKAADLAQRRCMSGPSELPGAQRSSDDEHRAQRRRRQALQAAGVAAIIFTASTLLLSTPEAWTAAPSVIATLVGPYLMAVSGWARRLWAPAMVTVSVLLVVFVLMVAAPDAQGVNFGAAWVILGSYAVALLALLESLTAEPL